MCSGWLDICIQQRQSFNVKINLTVTVVEAGLEIEEVLTEVPNIDFGDIQEV